MLGTHMVCPCVSEELDPQPVNPWKGRQNMLEETSQYFIDQRWSVTVLFKDLSTPSLSHCESACCNKICQEFQLIANLYTVNVAKQ